MNNATVNKYISGEAAALQYLTKRGALGKLATPCLVLYKDIICWKPKKLSANLRNNLTSTK
jgi:hypothetical protein